MPTDEERRNVAARLRNLAGHKAADEELTLDALGLYRGENIEGYDTYGVMQLADLIEPDPERTCKMELVKSGPIYSVWRFSCCGYEHSENDTDGGATELPGTRCPKCGAVVNE